MKKRILLSLLIFFAVSLAFAAGPRITLKNSTGYEIAEIFISPADSDDWGDDYLGNTTLDDGDSFTVTLPQPLSAVDTYDFQFIDIDGDSYTQFDVVIRNGSLIEMTFDDIDDDEDDDE